MNRSIAFIGAGKVGVALGIYFKDNGFEVSGYLSRSLDSAKRAAEYTNSVAYNSMANLLNDSDIVWITTPDGQIEDVANEIAKHPVADDNPKLILHASGALSAQVLAVAKQAGYRTAVAHPLMAFGNPMVASKELHRVWFAVEEEEEGISKLLRDCGNNTFEVATELKPLYHAAACVLSNYMVTLVNAAQQIFEKSGLPKQHLANATRPLIDSVIENLAMQAPKDALTGPIKRGDKETVQLHLDVMGRETPEMLNLYKQMGRETMKMIGDFKLNDILED